MREARLESVYEAAVRQSEVEDGMGSWSDASDYGGPGWPVECAAAFTAVHLGQGGCCGLLCPSHCPMVTDDHPPA